MSHRLSVEEAIALALAYGDDAQLLAKAESIDRTKKFLTYVAPALIAGVAVVGLTAVLLLHPAVLPANYTVPLWVSLMSSAFMTSFVGLCHDGGWEYRPLRTEEEEETNELLRVCPAAVAVHEAVLSKVSKIHWVHLFAMERAYFVENKKVVMEELKQPHL